MLTKFKQFVDEINAENGSNYKKSILEKYKTDEDIKYFEETKNQAGRTSLRFPVFKDIRFDKTEPNY